MNKKYPPTLRQTAAIKEYIRYFLGGVRHEFMQRVSRLLFMTHMAHVFVTLCKVATLMLLRVFLLSKLRRGECCFPLLLVVSLISW
jgi:hypothetical protein